MNRLILAIVLLSAAAFGSNPWDGILKPTYGAGACTPFPSKPYSTYAGCGIDWTHVAFLGQTGGAIPTGWTQYAAVAVSGDTTGVTDTNAINTALTNCATANTSAAFGAGQYVSLAAGNYYTNSTLITTSHCKLKGAGTGQTFINDAIVSSTAAGPMIAIGSANASISNTNPPSVTAGATAGSASLTLSSNSSLSVSNINKSLQYIAITELDLFPYVNATGSEGSQGGGFIVFNNPPNAGHSRNRGQIVQVTGCNGQTAPNVTSCPNGAAITIDPPLYTDYVHTLPSWASSTYYGWYSFIANGTHYYAEVEPSTSFKSGNSITAGTNGPITPNSMDGIVVGQVVKLTSSTPSQNEFVQVASVNAVAGTFTSTTNVVYTHNGGIQTGFPSTTVATGISACPGGCSLTLTQTSTGATSAQMGYYVGTVITVGQNTANAETTTITAISGNTVTAPFANSHSAGEAVNTKWGYGCGSAGSTPTFPTDGTQVADGTAANNMCVWKDMGVPGNGSNPPDTQPNAAAFTATAVDSGVEDVTILPGSYRTGGGAMSCIYFGESVYSWATRVECRWINGNAITIDSGFRNEVSSSGFFNTYSNQPGGVEGGSIMLRKGSSENLIENNILTRAHTCVVLEWGSAGNVAGYNYCISPFGGAGGSPNGATSTFVSVHAPHPQFNLFEGNVGSNTSLDSVWGTNGWITFFRNWFYGTNLLCAPLPLSSTTSTRLSPTCATPLYPNTFYSFQQVQPHGITYVSLFDNIIGDILGSSQASTLVDANNSAIPQNNGLNWNSSAVRTYAAYYDYAFGFSESADTGTFPLDSADPLTTALFHGVYQNHANTITWQAGVTHTLPASFYRTAQPAWWGITTPWGAGIGPDVTLGDGPGTHSYLTRSNPAQNCANNVMSLSDGAAGSPPTNFSNGSCYAGGTPPWTVTIAGAGLANGGITGTDAMNCTSTAGVTTGTCMEGHNTNDKPTYTATATTGSFLGWSGGGCSGTGTCQPTVTSNTTITARFDVVPNVTITGPKSVNIGQSPAISITTTNVLGAPDQQWTITATDAFNPQGYGAATCTTSGCIASSSPTISAPTITTTYSIVATANGVQSSAASITVNVQAPLSYGYYNH